MNVSLYLLTLLSLFVSFETALSSSTTCSDEEECEGETIDSTDVYCYGYYACEEADITATYGYMYGANAAYEATVDSEYIYGFGLLALSYADISTYSATVLGYLTCYYADIEAYSSTLYLELYGYFAGYYADVLCYSGDTCYVYCGEVYGCYELSYYCYSGATCYYDCSDDEDYCPTLYSGVESQVEAITELGGNLKASNSDMTDDEITAKHEESRKAASERVSQGEEGKALDVQIDFERMPEGDKLKREFEQAMKGVEVKNSKIDSVLESALSNNLTSFAGGMLCMLLVGKLYAIYRNKNKDNAYVPLATVE